MTSTKASLADTLWSQFGSLLIDEIPEDAKTVAGHCALDWFACALAGSHEPLSEILRAQLLGSDHLPTGPASIIGTEQRAAAGVAAMINGAAGHALDFDDAHTLMGGHPTVPVFPTALALAQELDSSGSELLAAFIVGVEVESRIGAVVGPVPYQKGWHSTSTLGIFGATAAACRLLGANRQQFAHALGLAASQSSGLKANFGTMTKPFHAGHAAERGLLSARLAMSGFTANPEAIEGNQGYADAAASGRGDLRWAQLEKYRQCWLIQKTLFKYHAACYLTHAAIESVGSLRRESGATKLAQEASDVVVTVHPGLLDVCGIPRPATGLEAKFSLTATTAIALLGIDTAKPATFVDQTLDDPQLQRLIESITIETDEELGHTQAKVAMSSKGCRLEAFHDSGIPASDLGSQGRKLNAKFAGLVEPLLGNERAARLSSQLLALEGTTDLRSLVPTALQPW